MWVWCGTWEVSVSHTSQVPDDLKNQNEKTKVKNSERLKYSVDAVVQKKHLFVCLLKDEMNYEASFCENSSKGRGRQGKSNTDNAPKQ